MEHELDNKLSFLDATVFRADNKFNCSVFRKSTFSGLGMSFFSFCTFNFKCNFVSTLLSRAYKVCSSYSNLHQEFEFLRNFFQNNGFPLSWIDQKINIFLNKRFSPNSKTQIQNNKPNVYISIPFFGQQSEKLKKEILKLAEKYFSTHNFKIILVNKFTIGSLFPYKDRLPTHVRSSLVYQFCCSRCESTYVGSTSRTLGARVAEHMGRSYRTNSLLTSPSHSSIRDHSFECDTRFNIDNFKILTSASNTQNLRILESLYIHKLRPPLNDTRSAVPLSIITH